MQTQKKTYAAPAVTPLGTAIAKTLGDSGGEFAEPYAMSGYIDSTGHGP
jgi:hypothetical protein